MPRMWLDAVAVGRASIRGANVSIKGPVLQTSGYNNTQYTARDPRNALAACIPKGFYQYTKMNWGYTVWHQCPGLSFDPVIYSKPGSTRNSPD